MNYIKQSINIKILTEYNNKTWNLIILNDL